jgi:collagenase-like PrtC family protease
MGHSFSLQFWDYHYLNVKLWGKVKFREQVLPETIHLKVIKHIRHDLSQESTVVVAGPLVTDIAPKKNYSKCVQSTKALQATP